MNDFLSLLGDVLSVFSIVGFVILGFSIAVKSFAVKIIKKIQDASDVNYLSIDYTKRGECDKIIENVKIDVDKYLQQSDNVNKIKKRNKKRKFFKLKQLDEPKIDVNIKGIFFDYIKNLAKVFYGDDAEDVFLKFSEKEIFYILNTLKERLVVILDSTKIIWLKQIKIAVILHFFNVYSNFTKSKIGVTFFIVKGVLDFCLKVASIFSPTSISKRLINGISSKNLKDIVVQTVITVVGKELSVIYQNKQLLSRK